jgi:hypothetical protein
MPDHPRFKIIDGELEDRHRHYYGAPAVDLVLGLVDRCFTSSSRLHAAGRSEQLHPFRQARLGHPAAAELWSQMARATAPHQRRPHGERG